MPAARSLVVVLVEDEALIRALMVDVLTEAGFDVLEAEHADEALAIMQAEAYRVSVLFTDIHMPGRMDGIGLVHHVHQHWPEVRLLIASGKARLGGSDLPPGCNFLPKPYNLHDTVQRVRQLAAT